MNSSINSAMQAYKEVYTEVAAETADPHKLVSMLFHGVSDRLCTAEQGFENKDLTVRSDSITKAQTILFGLRSTLDFKKGGELSRLLDSLYDYCIRQLTQAHVSNDVAPVVEVKGLIGQISSAWDSIPLTEAK
ncbi:MAG: flagellar export chaperone FliS [Gammaproteobacteria bacterium]|nr:flagellar export chaperone FliS [Gammaproteobacteria bacterium]